MTDFEPPRLIVVPRDAPLELDDIAGAIAGPNGAGKTTFALNYLPQVAPGTAFVNADLIAAGLSPLAPGESLFAASRLFIEQIACSDSAPTRSCSNCTARCPRFADCSHRSIRHE